MANELWIAATLFGVSTSAVLAQDVAAGETSFRKCLACHSIGVDAQNRIGPLLNGIDGTQVWKRRWVQLFRCEQKLLLHLERSRLFGLHQGSKTNNSRHKEVVFRHQGRDRGAEFVVVFEAVPPRWPTGVAQVPDAAPSFVVIRSAGVRAEK
jgi:hypothetical protein